MILSAYYLTETSRLYNTQHSVSQDYIVAQGTTGMWTWRKWESGAAECYGRKYIGSTNITNGWGGWYYHGEWAIDDYPFEFVESPCVTAFKDDGADGVIVASGSGSTTAPPNLYLVRPTTYSGAVYTVHVRAGGKWK